MRDLHGNKSCPGWRRYEKFGNHTGSRINKTAIVARSLIIERTARRSPKAEDETSSRERRPTNAVLPLPKEFWNQDTASCDRCLSRPTPKAELLEENEIQWNSTMNPATHK